MGSKRALAFGLCAAIGASMMASLPAAHAAGPALTRTPSSISYGNVQVQTTSSDQFVSVQNSGDATLAIGTVTLTGASPSEYVINSDSCSGASLPPNGSCFITIAFAPTTTGSKTASLSIPSNAPGSPATVSLSGTGVNPALTRTPSSIGFGNQQVATTSGNQFVSVQNTGIGNGPLILGSVTLAGTGASQFVIDSDSCSNATLPPNGSCFVTVAFAPDSTGAKNATLSIPSNAPTSPDGVALSGSGVNAGLSRTPSSIGFGNQQVFTSSIDAFVSVQNTGIGNGPLVIGAVSLGGANPTQFVISSDSCSNAVLPPNGSCFITVGFAPTATGAKSATLAIPSNAPTSPDNVTLSGTGVNPGVTRTPSVIGFGSQPVGTQSIDQFVTVQNTGLGNGPVLIGTVALGGSGAASFVVTSDSCSGATLSPNGSCFISVAFAPSTAGAKAATLSIPSNAPSSPDAVSLSGTGVLPVTLSPSSLSFGTRELGTMSAALTATVTNTGNTPVSIGNGGLTGANAADFSISVDSCSGVTLFSGQSCGYGVRFTPTALGLRSAALDVPTDGGALSAALSGTGVDTTGPASAWTTANPSVRISTLQNVEGTVADLSGVASVSVRFTDLLGSGTIAPATLNQCTTGNKSCGWSASVPLMLPGLYEAMILASDTLGNTSTSSSIMVIVI